MPAARRARGEALCRAVALSLSPFAWECPLALPGGAQAMCRVRLDVLREEWQLWEGTGCQAVPSAASLAVASVGLGWVCQPPVNQAESASPRVVLVSVGASSHPSHWQVHDYLRSKLCSLYENDCIFDKFECVWNGSDR